ncbi:right-handed parallel beta-helix repeat-containing protein [Candidatus Pacearchaeota archaeon]|nr:right-handed parallel beta-helix repeat-containing protein [Candidatus Pacearchaeota archaeon]
MTTRYAAYNGSNTSPYDTLAKGATDPQTIIDLAVAGDVNRYHAPPGNPFTLTASIDVDINSGSGAVGYIKHFAVNASDVIDGSRCVFDGNNAATSCLVLGISINFHWWENFQFKNAISHGVDANLNASNDHFWIGCSFDINGGNGINAFRNTGGFFLLCTFHSNTGNGFNGGADQRALFCSFHSNSGAGLTAGGLVPIDFIGCLIYDNTVKGIAGLEDSSLVLNCVIDANTSKGFESEASDGARYIIGSRITNQDTTSEIGVDANGEILVYGWNYFQNNDGANVQNATLAEALTIAGVATNQGDQSDTNQGYKNPGTDYELDDDPEATLFSEGIQVPII